MTSKERILTAINHLKPDRLPITFDAEKEVIEMLKLHFNVQSRDEVWNALHVDTRLVGAKHHYHHIRDEDGIKFDYWGVGQKEQAYSGGTHWENTVFPLADKSSVSDIKGYDWPTPDELSFEPIIEAKRNNPDKAIIAHITHAGFFKATHMRGLEQFMIDLAMDPDLAGAIINSINAYIIPAIEKLCKEAGDNFDIFYIADDFCTARGPMISPAMFREFIKPYLTRIASIVHSHGKKFLLHTCGSVRTLLPDIIEAGVDLLEPIQTSAVGMEVEGLKKDFGENIAFYGSIDLIQVLSRGTTDEVRKEVLKNFKILGKNGGFIVGPGHTYIQPDTPIENIIKMYETAYRECGY